MQYSKEQLTGLSREELVRIGHDYGIRATGMQNIDLVYEILDRSAVASASDIKPIKRGRPSKKETADKNTTPATTTTTTPPPARTTKPAKKTTDFQPLSLEKLPADKPAASQKDKPTPAAPAQKPKTTTTTKPARTAPARGALPADFVILEDIPAERALTHTPTPQKAINHPAATLPPTPPTEKPAKLPKNKIASTKTDTPAKHTKKHNPRTLRYDFGDLLTVSGLLETIDNYGFLRSADYNYLPSPDDIYISPQQLKQFGLKMGDVVEGSVQPPMAGDRYFTLRNITRINGRDPKDVKGRVAFEFLTPIFPNEKFTLLSDDKSDSQSSRIVDLFTPIGKGQRALIVAQPKTGKTLLMKDIANSIAKHHPEAYLLMLLIDERPEEVTDMARTVNAEVVASTFDAPAENHVKIATLVIEKAKRMVECGHDVVIFLDSITRLARAYNTVAPGSGKILSGGVDANALQKPKRFFGAARNIENGGSLTIIATALIDTGSKMDEVIFEEFKGTGNMELQLDRTLANKRIFPAVNLVASSTRRDELLLPELVSKRMWIVRKHIADMTALEAMDLMKGMMEKTDNNPELLISINS